MILPDMPPVEQVLEEIAALTAACHEYFPEAVRSALPWFTERTPPVAIDGDALTVMIRSEVRRMLNANGVQAQYEESGGDTTSGDSPEFLLDRPALIGLAGVFSHYCFRILKSQDGSLPVPGRSPRRQGFYQQQLPLPGFDSTPQFVRPNIILLWRFDQSWSHLTLTLSVPKAGGTTRRSVKEYYHVEIPHPVTVIQPETIAPPVMDASIEPAITVKEVELIPDSIPETQEE